MFAGPIIAREILTSPRPPRFYLVRASYAGLLFILMWTAWQSLIGWQVVTQIGVLARFGGVLYLMFAAIQLTLMLFFAPLSAASAVSHEKDRRTFILLLMTDLSDLEIVLGKLLSSLTQILTALLVGLPVLSLCALLGGISFMQIVNLFAVTAASGVAGGALGLVVALWRDRTAQSLSLTLLLVVFSIVGVEALAALLPGVLINGVPLVEVLNPYRALMAVLYPTSENLTGLRPSSYVYVLVRLAFATTLIAFGTWKLRKWNPGKAEPREQREGEEAEVELLVEESEEEARVPELVTVGASAEGRSTAATSSIRPVGSSSVQATTGLHVPRRTHRRITSGPKPYRSAWFEHPILWREVRTRAYGAKPIFVKLIFLLLAGLILGMMSAYYINQGRPDSAAWSILPVAILSLLLLNSQGVTSLTSERDSGALDLLLVTELTPPQFILGKLYGAMYNVKEMIAVPILATLYFAFRGSISTEVAVLTIMDFIIFCHFAAMLGLHASISYTNSRTAIANSLGTLFFLCIGILICAYLIILSDREFGRQLISFMIFIGAGSVGLYSSLGSKNPSQAIGLVSLLTPFWTFYCVISLLNGEDMAAFLFSVGIYGFAFLAMAVPAVSDFDIALGRTSAIQG